VADYPALPLSRVLAIGALAVTYFVLFVLSFSVILDGIGTPLHFTAIAWIRVAVFLLTLIPVTVAGIGVREAGFIGLLQLYGVPPDMALGAAVAAFAIQLLIGAGGATVAVWWRWRDRAATSLASAPPQK
jgi:uncharacterized membrane protein YbhN (UPF0104 family)